MTENLSESHAFIEVFGRFRVTSDSVIDELALQNSIACDPS
jgi:hypothetical protein